MSLENIIRSCRVLEFKRKPFNSPFYVEEENLAQNIWAAVDFCGEYDIPCGSALKRDWRKTLGKTIGIPMKKQYLGDTLDFWKGAMLRHLKEEKALGDLKVVPMFTDGNWASGKDKAKLNTYAKILGVKPEDVLGVSDFNAPNRDIYFSNLIEALSGKDIFFDPDTGLQPPSGRHDCSHITLMDLAKFTEHDHNSVVVVYQHMPRKLRADSTDADENRKNTIKYNYLNRIMTDINADGMAYIGMHAAMLFISMNQKRIKFIAKKLTTLLGKEIANQRIVSLSLPKNTVSKTS